MTQDLITDLSSALEGGEEPLGAAAAVLRRAFAVDRVSVARFDPGAPRFEIAAAAGAGLLAPGTVLPVSTCSYFAQVAGGHAFQEEDFDRSPDFDLPLDSVVRAAGFHAGCSVPIRAGGATVGALSLSASTRRDDIADAAARLEQLGPLLAAAIAPQPPGPSPARVLVLHADALVGRGLARLAERDGAASATVAPSVQDAVAALAGVPPDVVVCDLWTAGMRVDAVAGALREAGVAAPLLVVSSRDAPDGLRASRLAGAAGYLSRRDAVARLGPALAAVRGGAADLPDAVAPETADALTPREGELLEALEQGLRFKQVATRLGISEATAKTHGRNLFRKLGATSRAEAVHAARERGLLA
jgi:DNA-binding NarL/FixJ family response regulator